MTDLSCDSKGGRLLRIAGLYLISVACSFAGLYLLDSGDDIALIIVSSLCGFALGGFAVRSVGGS